MIIWASVAVVLSALALVLAFLGLIQASKDYDVPDEIAIVSRRFDGVDPEMLTITYPVPLDQDLQDYIVETAKRYGVSPSLVFAIIANESEYNAEAVSEDGHDFGLMQIRSMYHIQRCVDLGAWNLLDPYQNVRVGIDYLSELFGKSDNLEWVLMAYNGGENYANNMLCTGETSEYVKRVMDTMEVISEGIVAG